MLCYVVCCSLCVFMLFLCYIVVAFSRANYIIKVQFTYRLLYCTKWFMHSIPATSCLFINSARWLKIVHQLVYVKHRPHQRVAKSSENQFAKTVLYGIEAYCISSSTPRRYWIFTYEWLLCCKLLMLEKCHVNSIFSKVQWNVKQCNC